MSQFKFNVQDEIRADNAPAMPQRGRIIARNVVMTGSLPTRQYGIEFLDTKQILYVNAEIVESNYIRRLRAKGACV